MQTSTNGGSADLVLVEGAGGLNVRFSDEPPWTVADLAGRDRPSLSDVGRALLHREGGGQWAA